MALFLAAKKGCNPWILAFPEVAAFPRFNRDAKCF